MTRAGTFFVSALIAVMVFVLPSTIVAVGASKEQIRPVIEWVQREGGPNTINEGIAHALGLQGPNEPDLPIIHKAYKLANGVVYSFALATVNGRREIVLERYVGDAYIGWRMSAEGTVSKALGVTEAGKVTRRDGPMYEKEFNSVLDFFISKAAELKPK